MNNPSGIKAVGDKVLVRPDKVSETTRAGLYLPSETRTRITNKRTRCVAVDIGPSAWEAYKGGPWCAIGDTILIGKYCGIPIKGKDGVMYKIINDADVSAVIEEGVVISADDEDIMNALQEQLGE